MGRLTVDESNIQTPTPKNVAVTVRHSNILYQHTHFRLGLRHHHPIHQKPQRRRFPPPPLVRIRLLDFPTRLLIQTNAKHFRVNYLLLMGSCGALSLIGSPRWLLVTAAVVGLLLVMYVFREDPLQVWGHHVRDWAVMAGLVVVSGLVAWSSSGLVNVILGLGVGLVLCGVHGLFRNTEGLFLNENETASQGLIGPTSSSV